MSICESIFAPDSKSISTVISISPLPAVLDYSLDLGDFHGISRAEAPLNLHACRPNGSNPTPDDYFSGWTLLLKVSHRAGMSQPSWGQSQTVCPNKKCVCSISSWTTIAKPLMFAKSRVISGNPANREELGLSTTNPDQQISLCIYPRFTVQQIGGSFFVASIPGLKQSRPFTEFLAGSTSNLIVFCSERDLVAHCYIIYLPLIPRRVQLPL